MTMPDAVTVDINRYMRQQDALNSREEKREEFVKQRTKDLFMALPDFYISKNGSRRWTNMDDALGGVSQQELISIARALRDGDNTKAGELLGAALIRVCEKLASDEFDEGLDQ